MGKSEVECQMSGSDSSVIATAVETKQDFFVVGGFFVGGILSGTYPVERCAVWKGIYCVLEVVFGTVASDCFVRWDIGRSYGSRTCQLGTGLEGWK